MPTVPDGGSHPDLAGASKILEVKASIGQGRHVTTREDLAVGDVLFSEVPYSSVLLPEHYSTHCHHCYKVNNLTRTNC